MGIAVSAAGTTATLNNIDLTASPMTIARQNQAQLIAMGVAPDAAAAFLEKKHRFFGKTVLAVMPAERTLDVDEPADLEKAAEILVRRAAPQGGNPP